MTASSSTDCTTFVKEVVDEKKMLPGKVENHDSVPDETCDANAPSDIHASLEADPEPVCNVDDFPTSVPNKATTILTPPPNFQDVRDAFPKNVQDQFSELLHGKIVGIWPIRSNYFIKNKHTNALND